MVRSCGGYCTLPNTMSSTRQKKRIAGFGPRNSCASLKESVYSQMQALAFAGLILAFSTVQKRRVRWASRLTHNHRNARLRYETPANEWVWCPKVHVSRALLSWRYAEWPSLFFAAGSCLVMLSSSESILCPLLKLDFTASILGSNPILFPDSILMQIRLEFPGALLKSSGIFQCHFTLNKLRTLSPVGSPALVSATR